MMLIGSDVIRVSWYLIYPSIALARGKGAVKSGSAFCQVSGFLLAFGTEASGMLHIMAFHDSILLTKVN